MSLITVSALRRAQGRCEIHDSTAHKKIVLDVCRCEHVRAYMAWSRIYSSGAEQGVHCICSEKIARAEMLVEKHKNVQTKGCFEYYQQVYQYHPSQPSPNRTALKAQSNSQSSLPACGSNTVSSHPHHQPCATYPSYPRLHQP